MAAQVSDLIVERLIAWGVDTIRRHSLAQQVVRRQVRPAAGARDYRTHFP